MRIVIVGSPVERDRLRRLLAGTAIDIVDEAPSIDIARTRQISADGILVAAGSGRTLERDPPDEPLTAREMDMLHLLAEGLPNKAIAARLSISDQTVKFHVASICGKLSAANRTEAVRLAIRRGLIAI